jgi:catalase
MQYMLRMAEISISLFPYFVHLHHCSTTAIMAITSSLLFMTSNICVEFWIKFYVPIYHLTVNENGEAVYVKWHLKTDQGIKNLPASEADRYSFLSVPCLITP